MESPEQQSRRVLPLLLALKVFPQHGPDHPPVIHSDALMEQLDRFQRTYPQYMDTRLRAYCLALRVSGEMRDSAAKSG